jgi:acyl-CoA thioester hydrolase
MNEFIWPVRVYWEDTDAGGVVYYANYLKFLERARSEWLRALGIDQIELATQADVLFVVRRVEADYLRPARFDDALSVHCRLAERGRASLTMAQRILRGAEVLLEAQVKVACVSANGLKPRKIPDWIAEKWA